MFLPTANIFFTVFFTEYLTHAEIYCVLVSALSISCDKNKLVIYFQNNVVLKYSDIVKIWHCLQVILIVTDAV